jgi:hypothetical protein
MALKTAPQAAYSTLRRWWSRGKIWISKSVKKDLACIADLLLDEEYNYIEIGCTFIILVVQHKV